MVQTNHIVKVSGGRQTADGFLVAKATGKSRNLCRKLHGVTSVRRAAARFCCLVWLYYSTTGNKIQVF
jgi:hypothetical protein